MLARPSVVYKPVANESAELAEQQANHEGRIAEPETRPLTLNKSSSVRPEFSNTIKTAATKMRAASAGDKDILCRILLLNLRVDNEKWLPTLEQTLCRLGKSRRILCGGDRDSELRLSPLQPAQSKFPRTLSLRDQRLRYFVCGNTSVAGPNQIKKPRYA